MVQLYDRLLLGLREAAQRIEAGDAEAAATGIDRASAVLLELLRTLDFDAGDDLVARLAALYTYFLRVLGALGVSLDRVELGRVIALVEALHEGWDEAAAAAGDRRRGTDR